MDKIVLALVCLFAFSTPAVAGPLETVDSPAGERAMLVLNPPQAPAQFWDGSAWNPGPTGILWQESEGSRYCTLRAVQGPRGGWSVPLQCRDFSVPGVPVTTIAPPPGLSFGSYDSELSLAATNGTTLDALFDVMNPDDSIMKEWWAFNEGQWRLVLSGIPAIEDAVLDSRGESACVVWAVPGSVQINAACDWYGSRIGGTAPAFTQVPTPDAEWVSGLVVTTAGFAAVAWHNAAGGFETASLIEDGTVAAGPPGHTLVLATTGAVAYNDGNNNLVAWDPWGLSQLLYTWPAVGWGIVGEHNGNVYAVEQASGTGALSPLTRVY
jgi:hypothetical protein